MRGRLTELERRDALLVELTVGGGARGEGEEQRRYMVVVFRT